MIFTHDFAADCEQLLASLHGEPIALARFCDGEHALLAHQPVQTADGWTVPLKETPFTRALRESLAYSADGYHVGISPPCCQLVQNLYYRQMMQVPEERGTFANVLVDGNHDRVVKWALDEDVFETCAIVAPTGGHYTVPANAVNHRWDLPGLVTRLLSETRPILVAAGPAANIIVHHYWLRQVPERRVTILDIGSALDVGLHGKPTRNYHYGDDDHRKKVCSWTNCKQHSTLSPC